MAIVYPKYEIIKTSKVLPTEGELYLLDFLIENLDDNYEIYYEPFLNGDRPDIVVIRKDAGVLIIEVKDWHLEHYQISTNSVWKVTDGKNEGNVKSPFKQVLNYKENIFNLHVDSLAELKIRNTSLFSTVVCCVYFHNTNEDELKKRIIDDFSENTAYQKYISHFVIFGRNSLTSEMLKKELHRKWLDRSSRIFPECIYKSLKRYIQPPFHPYSDGKEPKYAAEQRELIISKEGSQKIKGVAGSGKTIVLAKRAVNAHKRTGDNVLILTYNITMRNYIHDKISNINEEFSWENFHIIHYHQFIIQEANNLGLHFEGLTDFENENFFKGFEDKIKKYDVVLIDEGQDFKYEWMQIIKKYFLKEKPEYVLFADEKQNIYARRLDNDKRTRTNIVGRWNESLNKSYRLSFDIAHLSLEFQKEYLSHKYNLDQNFEISRQKDAFVNETINYKYLEKEKEENIEELIHNIIKDNSIHPNDICILAPKVSVCRSIDWAIRNNWKEKTKTMFETNEVYKNLHDKYYDNEIERFHEELKSIRRSKKFNFWMNPGTVKLSTIHSFKGWEINTLFLIITDKNDESSVSMDELIYTGITRCRNNLFIINLGVEKYHKFFESKIALFR